MDILQTLDVIEALENFLDNRRPPEEIRDKVDIAYKIEEQSVIIFELRPHWRKSGAIIESPIAKSTFVKKQNLWKVFWMQSDLKWHLYKPNPTVKTIRDFVYLVEEDKYDHFWG